MSTDSAKQDKESASWTASRLAKFLDICADATPNNFTDGTFKSDDWSKIMDAFNKACKVNYNKQQLQRKLSNQKKLYTIMKSLRDQSGFGWDETNQTVTADESVWERYCSAHPDAAQFKN